ncbi:MAG: ComF family protein [Saprospiraceae bacterium]
MTACGAQPEAQANIFAAQAPANMNLALPPFLPSLHNFLNLFFPQTCVACGLEPPAPASCFCRSCQTNLLPTGQHLLRENEFSQRFWGLLPIQAGAAMFHFVKKSPVQRALHQLKYRNRADVGLKIGRQFGRQLLQSELFRPVDVIVPVPLHPKKERIRGYNQSAKFAEGLGEAMQKPVENQALARQVFSQSQTQKSRSERFQNVGAAFVLKKRAPLEGKNVLLVDDVLTTGATLESCGRQILEVPGTRLFLATIAIAERG